jgi:hypothetical protein
MKKVTIDTRALTKTYTKAIVSLEVAKYAKPNEYYDGAMPFLAGYLESQLVSVIDMLPKAKRLQVLADMARETLRKEAQVDLLKELA